MRKFVYNTGQQNVINDGVYHVRNGNKQVFQFAGEAGTGKSVVLNAIAEESGINKDRIAPMAYTGTAAMIMRMKGFPNARTIHSWLYEPIIRTKIDKDGKVVMDEYLNVPKTELFFAPKDISNIDYFFIDEGYMVPRHMKKEIESRGKKIIVGGDASQLKPVADEPAYLYDTSEVKYLTEVMRQRKNSGILYIARRILDNLPIHTGFYGDCLVIDEDDLYPELILGADIILCGTNATRERYNKLVREDILKIDSDLPIYKERVICRKNDWFTEVDGLNLANGLCGQIITPPDISLFDGETFKIDFKPDLFPVTFNDLNVDYEYFNANHNERQMIKNRRFGNIGQKFESAYSITTHLSQGSQHSRVIYIQENMYDNISIDYTAVTRASEFLIFCKRKRKYY